MSRERNKIDFGTIFSLALYSVGFANGFATVQNIASWKQNVGCLTQQNVNRTDVFADPTLKELGIMFFSLCLPLDPKTMKNEGFYTPNIWVITPKNEGCGFPWYILSILGPTPKMDPRTVTDPAKVYQSCKTM